MSNRDCLHPKRRYARSFFFFTRQLRDRWDQIAQQILENVFIGEIGFENFGM